MSIADAYPEGLVPESRTEKARSRLSLTSDIVSFRRCKKQYGYYAQNGFVPAEAAQVFFGQIIHQVLDRCHRHYGGWFDAPAGAIPEDEDIDGYFEEVESALRAHGVKATTRDIAEHAKRLLKAFNTLEGPDLYPRVLDTEYQLESDHQEYVLKGVVDVLARTDTGEAEIWDYKGSDFPGLSSDELQEYIWQMSVYAELYRAREGTYPGRAVLYFLNTLKHGPSQSRPTKRPKDAIYVVDFMRDGVDADGTPTLVRQGLDAFQVTARDIIEHKERDSWPAPSVGQGPGDNTCDICDLRWHCPTVAGKYGVRMLKSGGGG